jgi:hypothetical protein
MEPLGLLGWSKFIMKNILEDITYVEPDLTLPVPDGMCKDCVELNLQDMCDDCKDQLEDTQ